MNAQPPIIMTPLLRRLLDDMKLYKLDAQGEPYLHAGDLYEHSIWTYNAMAELLNTKSPTLDSFSFSERQKEVICLAALLHDIGKAGRKDLFERSHPKLFYTIFKDAHGLISHITYYQDRQEHPQISFDYAAKPLIKHNPNYTPRDYYIINQTTGVLTPFNMAELYAELGLNLEDQKLITILLGIHYAHGNLRHNKITKQQLLNNLKHLANMVNYQNGNLGHELLYLTVLIQTADVKGLLPMPAYKTPLFPEGITCEPTHEPTKFADASIQLKYNKE